MKASDVPLSLSKSHENSHCHRTPIPTMTKPAAPSKQAAKAAKLAKHAKASGTLALKHLSEVTLAFGKTYQHYMATLTPRLQVIDTFLAFLVALGVLQFVYVVVVGDFPFNAFLGGFGICVAQFVLTVSLRLQVAASDGERNHYAFGEYVFASVILHFIVFHFIN